MVAGALLVLGGIWTFLASLQSWRFIRRSGYSKSDLAVSAQYGMGFGILLTMFGGALVWWGISQLGAPAASLGALGTLSAVALAASATTQTPEPLLKKPDDIEAITSREREGRVTLKWSEASP